MTDCLLARIDILAYSKLYDAIPDSLNMRIDRIIDAKNRSLARINAGISPIQLRDQPMYGDTLDIFCESIDGVPAAKLMLDVVSDVMMAISSEGLLARGAICRGDLICDEYKFTGKAMVEAKKIEDEMRGAIVGVSDGVISLVREEMKELYPQPKVLDRVMHRLFPDGKHLNVYCHAETVALDCDDGSFSADYSYCLMSAIKMYMDISDSSSNNKDYLMTYANSCKFHNECCNSLGLFDQLIDVDSLFRHSK